MDCFESTPLHQLFLKLHPEKTADCITLKNWVETLCGTVISSTEERLGILKTLPLFSKLEEEELKNTLEALEELREALILSQEHIDHCFECLPETPKNRLLKLQFAAYLHHPVLNEDLTQKTWELISRFKTQDPTLKAASLRFVPGIQSSFLFSELVTAVKMHQAFSDAVEIPFSTLEEFPTTSPRFIPTTSEGAIPLLCKMIEELKKENPERPVYLALQTEPQWQEVLQMKLKQKGISLELSNKTLLKRETTSWFSGTLEESLNQMAYTRQQKESPLLERLQAYRKPLETVEKKELPPKENLKTKNLKTEKADVILTPWISLPLSPEQPFLSYADNTVWEAPPYSPVLSEWERDTLFQAGFQLKRKTDWENSVKERLSFLCSFADSLLPPLLYFPSDRLPQVETIPLKNDPPLAAPEPSYALSLGGIKLSATQLEVFSQCPAKYAHSRFRLQTLEAVEDRLALYLGQTVHSILEKFFTAYPEKIAPEMADLQPFMENEIKLLEASSVLPFTPLTQTALKQQVFLALEKAVALEPVLKEVFQIKQRLSFEKEFTLQLSGFEFRGKIDRIDETENGELVILDYKTGNIDFTPDHLAQGKNFQAYLYWKAAEVIYGKPVAAVLFYDLKSGEIRRGMANESCVTKECKKHLTRGHTLTQEKLDRLFQEAEGKVAAFGEQIQKAYFPPTPAADVCRYCDAYYFCQKAYSYGP